MQIQMNKRTDVEMRLIILISVLLVGARALPQSRPPHESRSVGHVNIAKDPNDNNTQGTATTPRALSAVVKQSVKDYEEAHHDASEQKAESDYKSWNLKFTAALVFCGFCQIAAMAWQAFLTRNMLKVTRDALYDVQRASLHFTGYSYDNIDAGDIPSFSISVQNLGMTAGHITRFACQVQILEAVPPEPPIIAADIESSPAALAPGAPPLKFFRSKPQNRLAASPNLTGERGAIYAFGFIEYLDIFQKSHQTWFGVRVVEASGNKLTLENIPHALYHRAT